MSKKQNKQDNEKMEGATEPLSSPNMKQDSEVNSGETISALSLIAIVINIFAVIVSLFIFFSLYRDASPLTIILALMFLSLVVYGYFSHPKSKYGNFIWTAKVMGISLIAIAIYLIFLLVRSLF